MNKINYFLLTGIVTGFLGLVGCGDDGGGPTIDPVEAVTDRLAKTWVVGTEGSVMFGSEERTEDYLDFSLTINENNTYTTEEVDVLDPWPESGTWQFTDEDQITSATQNSFSITRDDGLVISVDLSQDDEVMELNFDYNPDEHTGERVSQVEGQWTFILYAQE